MKKELEILNIDTLQSILKENEIEILDHAEELVLLAYNHLSCRSPYPIYLYGIVENNHCKNYLLFIDARQYKILSLEEFKYLFNMNDLYSEELECIINSKEFENWSIYKEDCICKNVDYTKCYQCPHLKECNELLDERKDEQATSDEFWSDYALCNPIDC